MNIEPITASLPPLGTVLVVEDDVFIRLEMTEMLRDEGFYVIEACCADEAVNTIEHGTLVDVVLTDIEMPGTMNGAELVLWLRNHSPETLTFLTSSHDARAQDLAPLTMFIPKPYRLDDVVARIRAALTGAHH